MTMLKRGQLSIETLIIYGLIILVALSAVAALIYFDVLNLGNYLPDSCNIGGTGDLTCEEMRLSSTANQLQLGLKNSGQRPIETITVTVKEDDLIHITNVNGLTAAGDNDDDGSADTSHEITDIDGNPISPSNPLTQGELAIVTIDISGSNGAVVQGSAMKATIITEYTFRGGAITQESIGTIRIKAT